MTRGIDLTGARVLVTGGSRGIGLAMAEALVAAGARVAVCGRSKDALCAASRALDVIAIPCDVTDEADVTRLVHAVGSQLGGLDVLVHNAGTQRYPDLTNGADPRRFAEELGLNLLAPMNLTSAFLPMLRQSARAAVVNVTSILAIAPKKSAPVYCASKAGLRAWTKALRAQLGPVGVRVVELIPPLVATAMTEGRDEGAVPPAVVASALVRGLADGREEIRVGKAKLLLALHRLSPCLAEGILIGR